MKGEDDEGMLGSRCAVDRGVCGARIRARTHARGGGLVTGGRSDLWQGVEFNRACHVNLTRCSPVQNKF